MSATQATTAPIVPPRQQANHFALAGHGLHVEYASTSLSGKPVLSYHDTVQTRSFLGDEISTVEVAALGTVVSVTLNIVPDAGRTTFSVILPHVALTGIGASSPVTAEAVTVFHRTSLIGEVLGQEESYTFIKVTGTATVVVA
jgi:hypothetical protein